MIFNHLVEVVFKGANRYLLLASVLTIVAGAEITALEPPIANEVEREAEEVRKTIENLDYLGIITLILWNNFGIMAACYFGGISVVLTPALGVWAVGRAVGAVILRGPLETFVILVVYGLMELGGFTLAILSGYRLTRYVLNRAFSRGRDSARDAFYETGVIIFYALMFIALAAVTESYLIHTFQLLTKVKTISLATILPAISALAMGAALTVLVIAMLILAVIKARETGALRVEF